MNFLLKNTLKNVYTKTIETSAIQSQRKYEYFFNKLNKINNDFEKKMDYIESYDLNINSKKKFKINKIKEWEGL